MTLFLSGGKFQLVQSKSSQSVSLEKRIIERIRSNGPITFAQYMEAALYDPEYGYYTSGKHRIGFDGDYFTSPSLSPAFGRTIAKLLPLADDSLKNPHPFHVLELGAGKGTTAERILEELKRGQPDLFNRAKYVCVERNRDTTPQWPIEWVDDVTGMKSLSGVVFSNEFFDALPVHRVVMRPGGLKEIMVTERDGKLGEIEADLTDPSLPGYFHEEGVVIADGQQAEVCLAARDWINKIGATLEHGLVVTIDYGYPAKELYAPYRRHGTLLAYHKHKIVEDAYQNIGEQDLTTHVDFTALARWGKDVGLEILAFTDQLRFFLNLGIHEVFAQMETEAASYSNYQTEVQAAKALIMPGGMGETFKVLVQYKGLDEAAIKKLRKKISSKYVLG